MNPMFVGSRTRVTTPKQPMFVTPRTQVDFFALFLGTQMLIISPADSADMAERIYRGYVVGIPTAMGNSATAS